MYASLIAQIGIYSSMSFTEFMQFRLNSQSSSLKKKKYIMFTIMLFLCSNRSNTAINKVYFHFTRNILVNKIDNSQANQIVWFCLCVSWNNFES